MKQDNMPLTSFADIFKKNKDVGKPAIVPVDKTVKKVCWLLKPALSSKKENQDV